jgi:hypothetical protein
MPNSVIFLTGVRLFEFHPKSNFRLFSTFSEQPNTSNRGGKTESAQLYKSNS